MPRQRKSDTSCNSPSSSDSCKDPCEDPSCGTCSDIRAACEGCDKKSRTKVTSFSQVKFVPNRFDQEREYCPPPQPRYDPGVSYFPSVITPLSNLTPLSSGFTGCVEFRMRRKNKTVTLQWEPFTGIMSASGVAFLTVAQAICNTPPYLISTPIYLEYKSVGRVTRVDIDPGAKSGNIRFYLNTDGTAVGVNAGDTVYVHGGCITWIVD